MSSPARHIAVVDLECTCSNTNAGDDTVRRDQMETIEIGAVMVRRHDFEPVDEFCRFLQPVVHHELTDFCKELTSITQHDVDTAPRFPEVYWRFAEWLAHWQAAGWGSWGNFDAYQIELDAKRHGLAHELSWLPPHVNVKNWWAKQMGMKRVGLGRAVQTAGLEWEGRAHRGIDDARMIAKLLPGVGWPRIPQGAEIRPDTADHDAIDAQRAQAEEDRRIEAEGTEAERAELRRRKGSTREQVTSWRPGSSSSESGEA